MKENYVAAPLPQNYNILLCVVLPRPFPDNWFDAGGPRDGGLGVDMVSFARSKARFTLTFESECLS
jgi:hypothetical protein